MAVRERSQSVGNDKNGARIGSRVYRVDSVAPAALILNPATYGLPPVGSVWESMIADSITITTASDPTTAYDAEVHYSTNGTFTFPKKLDPDLDTWAGSTYTESIALPYFKRITHSIPGLPGQPPQMVYGWGDGEFNISERRERVVRSVSVLDVDFTAAVQAIRNQTQKIHTFYSRQYLFAGATYSPRKNGVYTFDYTWEWDGGTLADTSIDRDRIVMPGPFKADGTTWANPSDGEAYYRPPYAFLAPSNDNPQSTRFTCFFKARFSPSGYLQLVNVGIP